MSKLASGLVVALVSSVVASQATAQPSPVATQFQVNGYQNGDQVRPSVCTTPGGDFVVTFLDHYPSDQSAQPGQDGSGSAPCLRRFAADGTPGFELLTNTYLTGDQVELAVACDPSGDFFVTWSDRPTVDDGGRTAFVGRAFDDFSLPKANPVIIAGEELAGGELEPTAVCRGAGGGFVVAWVEATNALFGRRYDLNGAPVGTEFSIFADPNFAVAQPSCCGGDAGFVVAWGDVSGLDVSAQRFSASAVPIGTELTVNTYTLGVQNRPAVSCNDAGKFVVVWDSSGQDGDGHGVFGRAFAADGTPVGTELQVNSYTTGDQLDASVGMDRRGKFVVVWDSPQLTSARRGVFAQAFDSRAAALGTEFRVDGSGQHPESSNSEHPAVAMTPDADFVVAWENDEDEGNGEGVFARLYDLAGSTSTTTTVSSSTTTLPAGAVCGDPVDPGAFGLGDLPKVSSVTASDALAVLRAAVGGATCEPCVCDVDDSGTISAIDALITLKKAVGQDVALSCPPCANSLSDSFP